MHALQPSPAEVRRRTWVYVPYDRLNHACGPLSRLKPSEAGLILLESHCKENVRPYHKKKLVVLLSNQRHFAQEQAARGVAIVYRNAPESYGEQLLAIQHEFALKSIACGSVSERELRKDLESAQHNGLKLQIEPDTAWLSTEDDWTTVFGEPRETGVTQRQYLMERFYRHMRKQSGLLMEAGKFAGGKLSYDDENRKPWRGQVPVPVRPSFAPDEITREVIAGVEHAHPDTFGSSEGFDLPTTAADVQALWQFALAQLLPHFGPYEDAMHSSEPVLFHSAISALMNLGRLLPAQVVQDVQQAYADGRIPLASAEGFIRQILGWREFMRHMHRVTDGYRTVAQSPDPVGNRTANAYSARLVTTIDPAQADKPAMPSALDAHLPLPPVYWGTRSNLFCMDTVVDQVVREGWSHHITRLMVLSNLATLCGFSPRELTDWFWVAYVDAYDWVVEPNVLGMSTFADGGLTATKPYVSGAAYINRMSNYCGKCALDPKKSIGPGSCPFTALYWTFLERNADMLQSNQRMSMPYVGLRRKSATERESLRKRAADAVEQLQRGEIVT